MCMLEQFKKFKKYKEYISWEFENKFALLSSVIVCIVGFWANIYEDFNQFVPVLNDLAIAIIGAYIGSLALIFSGVVFLGGLLNGYFEKKLISYSDDKEVVERLYVGYLFLAFNILCMIVLTIILMILAQSNLEKAPIILFEIVYVIYVYLTMFILAYFVALIRNTINLLIIARNIRNTKNLFERANEVRIDMIFQYMYNRSSPEETKKLLKDYICHYIDTLEDAPEMKDELRIYFSQYYGFDLNEVNKKNNDH